MRSAAIKPLMRLWVSMPVANPPKLIMGLDVARAERRDAGSQGSAQA